MTIRKTPRMAGAVLAVLATSVATPVVAQAPCVEDYSATCVVDAVQSLYEANIDWDNPETYLYETDTIGFLAKARLLLGDEVNARALMAHLTPVELERAFVNGDSMGSISTVVPADYPRISVAEAALSWLEALDGELRSSSAYFANAASTAILFAWAGQADAAKRIIGEAVASFAAAVAAGDMSVLPASYDLLPAAWDVGPEGDVETLLDILMRPEMAKKGISPDLPHWTNEIPLRNIGHSFLARGKYERAEAVWRAAKEIDDDWIESYLRYGPEEFARDEKFRAFSTLAQTPDITPQTLVAGAREIWPDADKTEFELYVLFQLVTRESHLDLPAQFLDTYPDLTRDFVALLPAWTPDTWEAADHCEGVACVGWASRLFSDPLHRQAVCANAVEKADTFVTSPPGDEGEFMDVTLAAIWAAEFCDPSVATRVAAFAEPLIFEISFSGLGALAVGYLAVASYTVGDDETGDRIVANLTGPGYQKADGLTFMATALEELGHTEKAETFIRQAWDVAAPYLAEADSDDPYYPYQVQTFVLVARATAAMEWHRARSAD